MRSTTAVLTVALAAVVGLGASHGSARLGGASRAAERGSMPVGVSTETSRPAFLHRGVSAEAAARALEVTWTPASPRQGTLFTVRARITGGDDLRPFGTYAGEALHFEADSAGWWALAAVAVDAEGIGELVVAVGGGYAREEVRKEVPIAAGRYAMERLSVAPAFTAPPDSALAARMERESARAMEVARGAHDTPRMWKAGAVQRPRTTRITSGFGNGRQFNGVVQSRHMGTDFAGAVGEPILAAADGIVRIVDQFYLGGRVVYLDHGGGLSSAYLHMSASAVAAGDTVRAGQRIGSVGATGRVTGPHLHWIVRYGGVTVDPLSLLEVTRP